MARVSCRRGSCRVQRMENSYFCPASDRVGDTEGEREVSAGPLSESLGVDKFAAFQPGQGFDGFASLLLGEAQVIEILEIEPNWDLVPKK